VKAKFWLMVGLVAGLASPAEAQLFGPESLTGAALGGLTGGIIGHNSRHRTAEGAAIGAGAGLLLGALAGEARRESGYVAPATPVVPAPPVVYYAPPPARPNYAVTGTIVGGIAGGVIGHNHHRQTAEGVAIGAGAGLVLGALAEEAARRDERLRYSQGVPVVAYPAPVAAPSVATGPPENATPVQPAPQPPPSIVNRASPMSGANSLFGRQ
jgi:outer membrane lipoprotein SlyB